mmetsp:Transcript_6275/g.15999  ORF Transcript_6275/g.15999 Transcript_6275/m.15999 type:complete len:495 (-) Transcript_6275:325-1809(-)|eukprot:CAMPEP_0202036920 /NCGR_PEP_ID=MMETSP0962-20130828/1850_1 /ASSEMBLY_ACC=CAM_ASM_000488 /TAXON_ID=4773 /ORGANISM="Schizochytrium aggregatum, Strain ATCC28209" /LENGTH=494 /DNA_ID=CAMNT_0048601019 /DNA_START=754 /DNA_END=2238 /DNA_ORIENTATION=-
MDRSNIPATDDHDLHEHEREAGEEQNAPPASHGSEGNSMYALLDAGTLGSDAGLMRDASAFGGLASPLVGEFRTNPSLGSGFDFESQLDDFNSLYPDVYRSVDMIGASDQAQMGALGQNGLDRLFQPVLSKPGTKDFLAEPAPRVFSRLRLEHTHMYISCGLAELVKSMDRHLKGLSIDFMFEPSGTFWRGMHYPEQPAAAVDFRIYLNSCQSPAAKYLIEFVRRSGCTMAFNQVFSRVRDAFLSVGLVTNAEGVVVVSVDELPCPLLASGINWNSSDASFPGSLLGSEDQEFDESARPRPLLCRSTSNTSASSFDETDLDEEFELDISDEELFGPLVAMARSDFEDVHVQGLSLVSHEAKKEGHAVRMVAACPGLVELIVDRLINSTHPEVRRNCCTSLCAFALEEQLHAELIAHNAPVVLSAVAAANYNPATSETQRQAAAALANLCRCLDSRPAVLSAVENRSATFQRLAETVEDERLKRFIADVSLALSA